LTASIQRILIVEDYEPFRRFLATELERRADCRIVGQASDGIDAVQKVKDLQPDMILLDIGLPGLNGIQVAKAASNLAAHAKLLFVSQECGTDMVREALRSGGHAYIHKPYADSDLPAAIEAVLAGKRFVSPSLPFRPHTDAHRHDVVICSNDGVLLDALTPYTATALEAGEAVIVLVNPSHRNGLLERLRAQGLDIGADIEQGALVLWDVRDALKTFMVNDWPDAVRFSTVLDELIARAAQGTAGERRRVVACGECAPTLWADGKVEAAIHVEHLWNQTTRSYGVDTLCVYPSLPDDSSFKRLCAEHTAVYSR
jgi:DNA-binding NarL/FixJ family response regulator